MNATQVCRQFISDKLLSLYLRNIVSSSAKYAAYPSSQHAVSVHNTKMFPDNWAGGSVDPQSVLVSRVYLCNLKISDHTAISLQGFVIVDEARHYNLRLIIRVCGGKTGNIIWIKPWCKLSLLVIRMRHILWFVCCQIVILCCAYVICQHFSFLKLFGFMETENNLINHKNLTLYDEKNYFSSLHKKKHFHIQLPNINLDFVSP